MFIRTMYGYRSKGQIAAKMKVPHLAYRAIGGFIDVFEANESLVYLIKELKKLARDGESNCAEIKATTVRHLEKVLNPDDELTEGILDILDQ